MMRARIVHLAYGSTRPWPVYHLGAIHSTPRPNANTQSHSKRNLWEGVSRAPSMLLRQSTLTTPEQPPTDHPATPPAQTVRPIRKNNCLVCGADLVYRTSSAPEKSGSHHEGTQGGARCVVCGGVFYDVMVTCGRGHFVCDSCHSADAVHAILSVCAESDTSDPLSLAYSLLEFPSVCMHGPEHHFLVPAVLITAYHNTLGSPREKKLSDLKAAKKRSSEVPGGWCGFCGCCGGAVGVGIFLSVVQNATPMSTREWSCSNQGTGAALQSLASIGGPRCCARATFNGVLVGQHFSAVKLGVHFTKPSNVVCNVFKNNKQCLGSKCPFHPHASVQSRSQYTQTLQTTCGASHHWE